MDVVIHTFVTSIVAIIASWRDNLSNPRCGAAAAEARCRGVSNGRGGHSGQ